MSEEELAPRVLPFKSLGPIVRGITSQITAAFIAFCEKPPITRNAQSPIEEKLLLAVVRMEQILGHWATWEAETEADFVPHVGKLIIAPQKRVGRYSIDFAVLTPTGIKVAVECDGHDFHERTKEQAAHDRFRDRFLTSRGWLVARFTGSEIHKDAEYCAAQVAALLRGREIS